MPLVTKGKELRYVLYGKTWRATQNRRRPAAHMVDCPHSPMMMSHWDALKMRISRVKRSQKSIAVLSMILMRPKD
jgi:hypothetical protein